MSKMDMNEVQDVVKEDGKLKTKDLIFAGAFGAILYKVIRKDE